MWRPVMREPAAALLVLATTIVIAAEPRSVNAGPGEAGRGHAMARATGRDLRGVDFVVLIWYREDRPLETFQHQTYDVRKGEYTVAVDDWLMEMREKHPRYVVRVLEVDLDRERGATEQLRVGSVIHRELLAAAAQSGVMLGAPLRLSPGPSAVRGQATRASPLAMPGGRDRSFLNSSPPTFPVPMPYPRPHP
jgi:hypothetical protein